MKNNKGLVEHARIALNEKWGYVWGTFGQVLTDSLLNQKVKQYPSGVGSYLDFIKKNWLSRKTADCVGLIKSYYWTTDEKVMYDSKTDVTADMMLSRATEKGILETIPDIPGICVHKKGHIGIYIGNGQVIEAHGTKYGVIQTPLRGSGATAWTSWLKCPYIEYAANNVPVETPAAPQSETVQAETSKFNPKVFSFQVNANCMELKDEHGRALVEDGELGDNTRYVMNLPEAIVIRGMKNPLVGAIQTILGITIDYSYGKDPFHETYDAIGNFQESKGLKKDYTVGPKTWAKLLG